MRAHKDLMDAKEQEQYWNEHMSDEEKKLRKTINLRLAKNNIHLRIMSVEIELDNNIMTSYIPPVEKHKAELLEAASIVQDELDKYKPKKPQ